MIEVINLSKSFQNNKAVNNINFDIGENEIIGLLGPNGCGKTTTIAMILGLLKPTKGKILINKKNAQRVGRGNLNLSTTTGLKLSGYLSENYSIPVIFMIVAAIQLLVIFIFPFIDVHQA